MYARKSCQLAVAKRLSAENQTFLNEASWDVIRKLLQGK